MNINNFIKFAEEASKNTQPPKSDNIFDKPELWQRRDIKGPVDTSKMPVVGWEREPVYMYNYGEAPYHYNVLGAYEDFNKFWPPRVLTQEERQKQFGKALENANSKIGQQASNNFLELLDYLNTSKDNIRKLDNTASNLMGVDRSPLMQGNAFIKSMSTPNPSQVIRDMVRKTEKYGPIWPMLHANGAFTGRYTEDSKLDEVLNKLRELSKKYY